MKRPYSSLAHWSSLRWSQIANRAKFGYSPLAGSHLKKVWADSFAGVGLTQSCPGIVSRGLNFVRAASLARADHATFFREV